MRLKAWLSEDPADGRRHPAVVFLHGGWMFGAVDWEDASGFVDAGFVLMIPMLRGENGNPGVYTGFYREVDDAIAAGRYVASLPYVDPERLYVAGHSVGAVLTTLTAMMPSPYKAGAALSGYLDMEHWVTFSTPEQVVFDIRDPDQVRMRNPFAFIPSLRIPLLLLAEPGFMNDISNDFCRKARRLGKACEILQVPGDHLTMAKPGVKIAAQWFRKQMHD